MKNILRAGIAALAIAGGLAATPVSARPMTQTDLATLRRIGAPVASPDGKWVAYQLRETDLAGNKGKTDLFLMDLTKPGAAPAKVTSAANSPAFSADGNFLYYLSSASGSQQVWRAPLKGNGKPAQVTSTQTDVGGFHVSPQGDKIAVWMDLGRGCDAAKCPPKPAKANAGSGREYTHLFVRHWDAWYERGVHSKVIVLPIANGKASGAGTSVMGKNDHGDAPSKPFGGGEEIAWAPDGGSLFITMRQAGPQEPLSTNMDIWQTRALGKGCWQHEEMVCRFTYPGPVNLTADNQATDTLPVPSPNGKWLAYAAMRRPGYESDRQVLMLRDLSSGQVVSLTERWDRSVGSIAWAPDSRSLIVTAQDTLDHPAYRVDAATGQVTRLTKAGNVSSPIPLANGGLLYLKNSIQAPDDLYRLDNAGREVQLTRVNADKLAGIDPVTVERFNFKGAGGDTVWGQIVKPANARGKLPVAFLIHGGPQGSFGDSWSYRWNPKLFASPGYAAVTIDFHGSTGYGQAFTDSINKDWGGKPLRDLQLGLAAAGKRDAQVDTANACALGASYGGYMVNWIAGQWPDGFKCIVQHDGVFDLRAMAFETEELWFDEWDHGGPWWERKDAEKWNPVNHVTKWKTPMLVVTGEKDFRIPYTQGLASFTALQRRGVPSKLLVFPDENHWVLKPKNSIQWYDNVFAWMDRWTKGAGGDAPPR